MPQNTAWEKFFQEVYGPLAGRMRKFFGQALTTRTPPLTALGPEGRNEEPEHDVDRLWAAVLKSGRVLRLGQETGYRFRDHAAAILGGYEQVFKLDEAGLRVVPLRLLQRKSEKIRLLSGLLRTIEILIASSGVATPTGQPGRPARRPVRPNPPIRSRAPARRRRRPAASGTIRGARSRSTGPTGRFSGE